MDNVLIDNIVIMYAVVITYLFIYCFFTTRNLG